MTEDSVVALHHPGVTADPLTEVLRAGARELLAQAIEAEVAQRIAGVLAHGPGHRAQAHRSAPEIGLDNAKISSMKSMPTFEGVGQANTLFWWK